MIEAFMRVVENQFQAALRTLDLCIDRCPDSSWEAPVANLAFCQAVFHTLFFTDMHLGPDLPSQRSQQFHLDHADYFRDYEELEDRVQVNLYDRPRTKLYVRHCHEKAARVLPAETAESLSGPSGFDWYPVTRGELYILSLRHVQHHAAQLSLRLRLDHGDGVPWVRSGWDR